MPNTLIQIVALFLALKAIWESQVMLFFQQAYIYVPA